MVESWAPILVFIALSLALSLAMLIGAWALRVKARTELPSKTLTYECGETPEGPAWIRFHPRFFIVALVFVLFDVEAVFLFPWALNIREMGTLAIVDMFVFVGILLLGWVYALRKGALRWQ